jgi:hypothetical protein
MGVDENLSLHDRFIASLTEREPYTNEQSEAIDKVVKAIKEAREVVGSDDLYVHIDKAMNESRINNALFAFKKIGV